MTQLEAWQQYLAERQAALQQQTLEALHQLQPWSYGLGRMPNALLSRAASPALAQTDPQAGMLPLFMGDQQGGAGQNPMLLQMLMGGSGGAL